MINAELISVIIPYCHNDSTIRKTVASALSQEGVSVEVVIVCDGRDSYESKAICSLMKTHYYKDGILRIFMNEENVGPAISRNVGVSKARGEYIAFLDADDWWAKEKLSDQLAIYKEYEAKGSAPSIVFTGRALCTDEGAFTGKTISAPENVTYKKLLKHNCINCSSVFMKKSVALEFPMENATNSHEDYVCWLRILKNKGFAVGINKPYLRYRMRKNSLSSNKIVSAVMTYNVYRYMGFSLGLRIACFISYAIHGIIKYS